MDRTWNDLRECGNVSKISATDNSIEGHSNTSETMHKDSQTDDSERNNSYSSFNSSSDIDMENCSSSTPINSSKTISPSSFIGTLYGTANCKRNGSFDANALVDRLRVLITETLDKVELCSDEMQHIVKVFRRNDVID